MGFSATVSARALNVAGTSFARFFHHHGMRFHRIGTKPFLPSCATTVFIVVVGQMLYAAGRIELPRSDARGRDQKTSTILSHAALREPTAFSTSPPCAQLTPSSASERAENTVAFGAFFRLSPRTTGTDGLYIATLTRVGTRQERRKLVTASPCENGRSVGKRRRRERPPPALVPRPKTHSPGP
jgi:hypothetical protein